MDWVVFLFGLDALLLAAAGYFTWESYREKEPRAPKAGLYVCGLLTAMGIAGVLLPAARPIIGTFLGLIVFLSLLFLIPSAPNPKALRGGVGYAVGEISRFDERDLVFARNRSLPPGSEAYRRYYDEHPEREAQDADRRCKGGTVGRVGAIDDGCRPNVAMIGACFDMPPVFGQLAETTPPAGSTPEKIDSARAAMIVKGFARRIGADLVGICRVNPAWAYSRRGEIFYGNWDDWGCEIPEPLPYAVVVATEMAHGNVAAGPHTPALFESAFNYSKGAFITTILARWFAGMGYRAAAQHSRHYDLNMVPLAIDAGLGELGRFGYLISDEFGPRVRLFAVTTDMPLETDAPVDLGVEGFCRRCLKCADSCPSRSIPAGDKTVVNGVEKWKMNAETCFDYWSKVGTDCSICMGVCPYSRPNRGLHRLARWTIRRSRLARAVFPVIDNFAYGKRWKPRPVAAWISFSGE
jgi:reductive dehalogenase